MNTHLTIVLNTHMPDVSSTGRVFDEPENWLFEAITETYIPLFKTLKNWDPRKNPGKKVVFSATPCLIRQLTSCKERYIQYLSILQKIASFEVERAASPSLFDQYQKFACHYSTEQLGLVHDTASSYLKRINDALDFCAQHDFIPFLNTILSEKGGSVELWTSSPDHNFLPFLESRTQKYIINEGVEFFKEQFGRNPDGYWLPECAFSPGVEKHLIEAGINQTVVTTHAIGVYHPEIKSGHYQHGDLKLLVQDHRLSSYIWKSPLDTLPANPLYREFYRDLGMDVKPHYFSDIGVDLTGEQKEKGVWTGIKYFACAKNDVSLADKPLYNTTLALQETPKDAVKFAKTLDQNRDWVYDRNSFIIAFDTEILGHWWHEGVDWLNHLLKTDLDA